MPYSQPIAQLYHATNKANLESIRHHGLRVKFCGAVHAGMEVRPPVPTVYLSRRRHSSNLHSDLFASTVVVLQIDMAQLDPEAFYPDDGLLAAVANGDILASPASIRRSLGLPAGEAATLHDRLRSQISERVLAARRSRFQSAGQKNPSKRQGLSPSGSWEMGGSFCRAQPRPIMVSLVAL